MVLLLCTLALLAIKEWKSAAVAAVASALAAIPIFAYLVPASDAALPLEREPILRALSLNVWFRNDDPLRLVDYLETSAADVIVLQEISEPDARSLHANLPSYPHAYVEGASQTDAVLFSRWPITRAQVVQLAERGVGAIRVELDWRGHSFIVLGAHLHWPIGPRTSVRRNAELTGLAVLAQAQAEPVVLLGDFNITPWSQHFSAFMKASGLRDCALGHGLDPTWPSQLLIVGIRIDHCFASPHWRVLDARVGPSVGSDHRPIVIDMALDAQARM